MKLAEKLTRAYFNLIYNPVYDSTTGRLSRYYKLQQACITKLEFKDSDSVLCVGVGTGNEVLHILKLNRDVSIVGVDYSKAALKKAQTKALQLGKEITVHNMDARHLDFPAGSFDKVLCIHVMDFVEDCQRVTDEIFRVLREEGQFAITYPSDKEGIKLGRNLLRDAINTNLASGKHRVKAIFDIVTRVLMGFVYLPLISRPKKRAYSCHALKAMITPFANGGFQVEEDPVYQDFIVYGRKSTKGGQSDAARR